MIGTVAQLREFLDMRDPDEKIAFVAIHPDDVKLLGRSIENKVAIVMAHPQIPLVAIAAGSASSAKELNDRVATIFLVGK